MTSTHGEARDCPPLRQEALHRRDGDMASIIAFDLARVATAQVGSNAGATHRVEIVHLLNLRREAGRGEMPGHPAQRRQPRIFHTSGTGAAVREALERYDDGSTLPRRSPSVSSRSRGAARLLTRDPGSCKLCDQWSQGKQVQPRASQFDIVPVFRTMMDAEGNCTLRLHRQHVSKPNG